MSNEWEVEWTPLDEAALEQASIHGTKVFTNSRLPDGVLFPITGEQLAKLGACAEDTVCIETEGGGVCTLKINDKIVAVGEMSSLDGSCTWTEVRR